MTTDVPIWWFLVFAALLFSVGLFGTLSRRNAVNLLMAVELMLNAVNLNAVALWRYTTPDRMDGQVFAVFIITLAAAEAAVGLALILAVYRITRTVNVDMVDMLQG